MSLLPRDLQQTCRALANARGLTMTVLAILALGFGLNAAMFSAAYHLLLRPLPFDRSDRLIEVFETRADGSPTGVALANLLDWRQQSISFSGLAAYRKRSFGFKAEADSEVEVVQVGMVTSDFLPLLAAVPNQGRLFGEQEERTEAAVIVLSDAAWQQHLQAGPAAGSSVLLNERPYTVVGVLPASFDFKIDGRSLDAYIPLSRKDYGHSRRLRTLSAVARLADGVHLEQARQELGTLSARLADEFPDANANIGADAQSLHRAMTGSNRRPLLLLVGAGLVLLLIASTSVADLLVIRLVSRLRQVAVRFALGAGATQVGRLFFLEAAVLCFGGAVLGLLLARSFLALLPHILPLLGGSSSVPRLDSLRPDAITWLAAFALALGATSFFGSLPTLLSRRPDLGQLLKTGGLPGTLRHRLRSALVVLQVALSVVLLLGCGLLLRSFFELLSSNPGFNSAQVQYFGLGLPEQRYDNEPKMAEFHRRLLGDLGQLPGVQSVGAVVRLPLAGGGMRAGFFEPGLAEPSYRGTGINLVSPGYFSTLGVPLITGRDFSWNDRFDTPRVLMVNQAFQRAFLQPPRGDVLERSLALSWFSPSHPKASQWQIIGVIGDMNERSLEQEPQPMVFLSMGQFPSEGASYLLRTAGDSLGLGSAVTASVQRIDGQLQRVSLAPLRQVVANSLSDRRLVLWLTSAFAGLALILTMIGIYGVVSFHVAQSRREIAIRMSLGAAPPQILRRVLAMSLAWVLVGCGLGTAAFWFLGRLIESQLYGIARHDIVTLCAVIFLLLAVATVAALLPARRASNLTPMNVLRQS